MIVRCAYRIQEDGEIFMGKFDTSTFEILDQDFIRPLTELHDVLFSAENYEDQSETVTYGDLMTAICKTANILVAIDLNDNGIIEFTNSKLCIVGATNGNVVRIEGTHPIIKKQSTKIGIRRAPLYTFSVMQKMCYAYGVPVNGVMHVVTQNGLVPVDGVINEWKPEFKSAYRELIFNDAKFYAICNSGGVQKFLKFDETTGKFVIL